jgi:hypothetical protein
MADKLRESWAICPSIPLKDRRGINGPLIFDSRLKADAFLKDATIHVYDGWGRGEETNFASREEWLQDIAGWLSPPPESASDSWESLSRAELMAAYQERERLRIAKLNRLPKFKRAVCVPPRPGSDVYMCPWPKEVRVAVGDLIGLALPVHRLSADVGPPCSRRLAEVQPDDLNATPVSNFSQLFDMCKIDPEQTWMYCLDRSWRFARIVQAARQRKWHNATKYKLKIDLPRLHFWRIVLELEESLHNYHLKLSATSLQAFWTSWQVARHLSEVQREIEMYAELPGAVAGQTADIGEAVTMVKDNLRYYASSLGNPKARRHAAAQRSVEESSGNISPKQELERPKRIETEPSIRGGDQPAPGPEPKPRVKPGPKRNLDVAHNVLAVIERFAAKNEWKSKLEEVCDALDEANIPRPTTWPKRNPPIRTWSDAFSTEADLAKKAISYRLKNAEN